MDPTKLDFETLKRRQKEVRDSFSEALSLRTHRALSWLQRAEQEAEDHDAQFIFLWVAFNAAYAQEIENRQNLSERRLLLSFLAQLVRLDRDKILYEIVWNQFTGPIRLLIDNRYVFQPFWDYQNGRISDSAWQGYFAQSKAAATRALGAMNTVKVLAGTFDRLYTLRNQLIHGGAT